MRAFLKRVPYRRTVVCPCGQPIGNDRAAKRLKRCTACVERFAHSQEPKPVWWQEHLFGGAARPSRRQPTVVGGKTAPAAPPPPSLPPPPPAPPKPTAVDRTKEHARRLEGARIRADHDPRLALFLQLRAAGVSRSEAEEQVDAAFPIGRRHDP